jgi:putative glutamine amidotransferase
MPYPRILVPLRQNVDGDDLYLGRDYATALHAAGLDPVYVPLIPDAPYLNRLARSADGILLSGSNSDVDPARYGEPAAPGLGPVQPLRDATDWILMEAARRDALPLLAICYGLQALNVFHGGSLHQDLAADGYTAIGHRRPAPGEWAYHPVRLAGDLPFLDGFPVGEYRVNSSHHQAIRRLGAGLEPFAWSPDGLVEGVHGRPDGPFLVGVQWHPESCWRDDPLSAELFRRFFDACSAMVNR